MDDCSKNLENCLRDLNNILFAVAKRYGTSELEILYNKERKYLYVKFLIGLYLFNKGYRHREIGRVINADRTHVYNIIERATDIMKSRDKYYDQMKECVRMALCDIGSTWNIMTKFI